MWAYEELASRARDGCDPAAVPSPFGDAEHARSRLPLDWHLHRFDPDEAIAAIAAAMTTAVPVAAELAALRTRLE
jgi:hypothetical protein